jgi:hypothetical protein
MRLSRRPITLLTFFLLALPSLQAQQSAAPPNTPTVTFKFNWDEGRPWSDYTFTVAENGATHFSGTGNAEENGADDHFEQDFTMSEGSLQKIFGAAKATDYFHGEFESKQKNIAKTGSKTLQYHSPSIDGSTTYNYSPNPNIQQLTKLFQAIALTLDYGRKLAFGYRFDKLGMDKRLQELTDLHANGMAEEMQAIAPILRKIADDADVMNIAREQAKQLLKSANTGGAAPSNQNSSAERYTFRADPALKGHGFSRL